MNTIAKIQKSQELYQVILDNGIILNVSDLMVLDFDGAQNVAYRNEALDIAVENITVAASLEAETQAAVLEQLNATASGVYYLTTEDADALKLPVGTYSTIYVGDTDDLDKLGGAFSGIAETSGATAAANKADNAFVLTNRIGSVEELASVIAHEAGHLAGTIVHDYASDGATLDDFMNDRTIITELQTSTFNGPTDFFSGQNGTYGGAILNEGTVTFNAVEFTSNSAASGGAMYNKKTTIINGGTFSGNSAGDIGGAIATAMVATITINDATFTSNLAAIYGGAIGTNGAVAINGGMFNGNSAGKYGGVVNNNGATSIYGGTYANNSAGLSGGVIYMDYAKKTAIISGGIFTGNLAGDRGGAIYNGATATISGGSFTGNSASNGGAIHNCGSATISGTMFSENSAHRSGGAIYNTGIVNIDGGIFFRQ